MILFLYLAFSYIFAIGMICDYIDDGHSINWKQVTYVIAAPVTMPFTMGARR